MIIVAGAGSGGLVSALKAADQGIDVLLLEVNPRAYLACNSARSTGMVMAAGSRLQQSMGIDHTWEDLLADILTKNGGDCPTDVAEALAKTSAHLVDWLVEAYGIPLSVVTDFRYPGHTKHHMHATPNRSGRELVDWLWRAVRASSRITIAEGVKLDALRRTEHSRVDRVLVRYSDGATECLTTDGVVIATNGFGSRRGWIEAKIPTMREALYFGGPNSDGSGIEAAINVGADTAYMDAYQGHATVSSDTGMLLSYSVVMTGGVLVSSYGSRFADETRGYSELAEVVLRQPGGIAYAVFDHRAYTTGRRFSDFRQVDEMGAIRMWEDLDDLGKAIGFETSTWRNTQRAMNGCQTGTIVDIHGRAAWSSRWSPPFYAVRVQGALLHTQGGLVVNNRAQVMGTDGNRIPGLYACGGAAAGISGHGADGYLSGNGLLSAMGLGYLASASLGDRCQTDSRGKER